MFQSDNFTSLSAISSSSRPLANGRQPEIGHGLPSFDIRELCTGGSIWGDGATEVACNSYQLDSGYQTTGLGSSMPQSTFISRRPSRDSSPLGRGTLPQMSESTNMATTSKETFRNSPMPSEVPSPWPRRSLPPPENPAAASTRLRMQIKVNEEVDVVLGQPNEVLVFMRNLWEQEVTRARQWLQEMSWSAHAEYHSTQDQIAVMEEQFRRSFNIDPPQGDFISKECYDEIICADTLLSMVDNAWAIMEEDEEEDSPGDVTLKQTQESQPPSANISLNQTTAPIPTLPRRPVNNSYAGKVRRSMSVMGPTVSPATRVFPPRSTAQPIPLLPADQISRMTSCPDPVVGSTALHRRSSLPAGPKMNTKSLTEDNNVACPLPSKFVAGGSGGSSSASSTSMQVHKRSMKPRKQDAFFNIRYKTQECVHYKRGDQCPAGENCHFAHGSQELRTPRHHPKFKTQECKHYSKTGHCPYGKSCFFLHTAPLPAAPKGHLMSGVDGTDNCNKNGGNLRQFK